MENKVSLTIKEMIEIEPALSYVEDLAKRKNEEAKNKEISWFRVWVECKKMQEDLIGDGAINKQLSGSKYWDDWHNHLMSLTPNTL